MNKKVGKIVCQFSLAVEGLKKLGNHQITQTKEIHYSNNLKNFGVKVKFKDKLYLLRYLLHQREVYIFVSTCTT